MRPLIFSSKVFFMDYKSIVVDSNLNKILKQFVYFCNEYYFMSWRNQEHGEWSVLSPIKPSHVIMV